MPGGGEGVPKRACGARPSEGASQGGVALRGRAGDGARSEFCGRMRSARPKGSARRMTRHGFSGYRVPCPGEGSHIFSRPGVRR